MAASGVLRPQLIHGLDILIILSTMYLDFSNQRRAMLILAEKSSTSRIPHLFACLLPLDI